MNDAVNADLTALAERLAASTVAVRVGRHSAGSGIVWNADGTIVTNAHVASGPRAESVLADGRRFDAFVERSDPKRDLALLRIEAGGLNAVSYRDPATLRVGEILVALGYPHGVPNALTMGIVHVAPGRYVSADLRIAPGNSGGPLADVEGRVVGINSMAVAGRVALAVPSDAILRFVNAGRTEAARAA